MKLQKTLRTNLKIFSIIILVIVSIFSFSLPAVAVTQEDLDRVEKELEEIRRQQNELNNSLKNQKSISGQYGAEIYELNSEIQTMKLNLQEKQLVIDELNIKVSLLQEEITSTESAIKIKQENIKELEEETDARLAEMYLNQKSFDNGLNMIFATDGTGDFIKDGLYREAMQEDTNKKLDELSLQKENLEKDKEQLKTDKVQVETDKSLLEEEKNALESQQTILAQKKNKFESLKAQSDNYLYALQLEEQTLTAEEKAKQVERERIRQQLFGSITDLPNGTYIGPNDLNTAIGMEGETGLAQGVHLHFAVYYNGSAQNPCSYLPAKSLRAVFMSGWPYITCGVSNPTLPAWPMHGDNFDYTSPFGPRWGSFHYAIDLSTKGYNASSPIYPAHTGYLSYRVDQYGGKYAVICENKTNCNSGLKTIYLHLK